MQLIYYVKEWSFIKKQDLELLNTLKVGIVGGGHLGQAIARSLVDNGLEKENLIISYSGNPGTCKKLETEGLSSCIGKNERIFQESGIILITVKPQDILELKGLQTNPKSLIASCMAGVPIKLLNKIFINDIYRMMLSGPDSILSGKGVAALCPEDEHLRLLIALMNLKYIRIGTEVELDVFTAGVCMPAAILNTESPSESAMAIKRIGAEYPLISELYEWAVNALPVFQNSVEKDAYIERMITKGGITDAIINSLKKGETFDISLRKGIARTKEISIEIQKSILK